jgi:two-component system, OmpR family, sensor kinase
MTPRLAPRSFRGKIVASTVMLMVVAMLAVGLGIQLLLEYTAQRDIDGVLQDRADATVELVRTASVGRLTVPPDSIEPGVLVYDARGQLLAGSIESGARATADDLASTRHVTVSDTPEDDVRLRAVPFTTPGGEAGVVVVSQETTAYERSEFYALVATGALALLVVAGTTWMALRVTRRALSPVTQMAERATDWSEHDLTHRFDLGPPTNELAALGETLDHLLDRVSSAIRSEQRLTAELAHELRTPLTSIQGSADLALMRGVDDPDVRRDLEQISGSAHDMAEVITTLLDLARDRSASSATRTCSIAEVLAIVRTRAPAGVELVEEIGGSSARVAAPAELVARAMMPLVDNAVRHASSRVVIRATDGQDAVALVVSDDGPGVSDSIRDSLFEPGRTEGTGGSGLGLGIARRVARSFGADVHLLPAASGAVFELTLPRR